MKNSEVNEARTAKSFLETFSLSAIDTFMAHVRRFPRVRARHEGRFPEPSSLDIKTMVNRSFGTLLKHCMTVPTFNSSETEQASPRQT